MTVQNVIVKNIGIGNGSTTRWPYTFACPKEHADFIKVYVRDNDDKLSLVENYWIDTESKMVTYPIVYPEPGSGVLEPRVGTPLAEGERIVIARELPLYQLLNLIDQGSFYAEDIELTFDELVMMIQQLNEKYDRTMTLEIDKENFNMAMPIKAGYGWRVSDDGKSIVLMENPEEVYKETVTTYQQTLGVYNNTVTVKTDTSNIQKATQDIYDKALADINEVKSQVQVLAGATEDYSELAHRWADSDISPDGQVDSKSSKTWAEQTASYLDDAIKLKDYAEALAEQIPQYDNNTVYNAGDVVFIDNGDAYRALVQVQGENPAGSFKWAKIQTITNTTFEMDEYGDLMPKPNPTGSTIWDIDENGDITPTAYGSGTEQKPADDIIIENQRNIGKNKVAIDGLSARVDELEEQGGGSVPPELVEQVEENTEGLNAVSLQIQRIDTRVETLENKELPIASGNEIGGVKINASGGIQLSNTNYLQIVNATSYSIGNRSGQYYPITPPFLDLAVKQALCDKKGADYTEEEQKNARERIGIDEWELIETITVGAETTLVTRTTDTNGKAYNFQSFRVIIYAPALSATLSNPLWVSALTQTGFANSCRFSCSNTFSTSAKIGVFDFCQNGIFTPDVKFNANTYLGLSNVIMSSYPASSVEKIIVKELDIRMGSNIAIPEGTLIKIYGVWA